MSRIEAEIWPLPSPVEGELQWLFQGDHLVGLRGAEDDLPVTSPLFALGGFPTTDRGSPLPLQFKFDPATGHPLREPVAEGPLLSHPGLGWGGFPAILDGLHFRTKRVAERMSSVPAGVVAFFTAGTPARIFALTDRGHLFFRAAPDAWEHIVTLAPLALPRHAFGVCAFEEGFAAVLDPGVAVVVHIVRGLPGVQVERLAASGGAYVGAPALLPGRILAFPRRGRGAQIILARYNLRTRSWLEPLPVKGELPLSEKIFSTPLQIHAQNPDTFWTGSRHYLKLSSDFGEWTASVQSLPEGLSFICGAPVLRDERDALHALVRGADFYAFQALSGSQGQMRLDGPSLAAGRGWYFARDFHPSPSSGDLVTLQVEAGGDRVLLPLAFGLNKDGDTEGVLVLLVKGVKDIRHLFEGVPGGSFSGALYWHGGGTQLHALNINLTFATRFDILLFTDNTHLFVGSSLEKTFYRVSLR